MKAVRVKLKQHTICPLPGGEMLAPQLSAGGRVGLPGHVGEVQGLSTLKKLLLPF